MAGLARWDRATAGRVDRFVANSQYVAGRIRRYYNRESTVVYPPVDTAFFTPGWRRSPRAISFLVVSALVPYKRIDVAIDACRRLGVPLTIVGDGPEQARLAGHGRRPTSSSSGRHRTRRSASCTAGATAVLLPGEEDFGIVPVEAQACGRPVVALGRGGALETVVDGETGVLVLGRRRRGLRRRAAGAAAWTSRRFDPAASSGAHAERFRPRALRDSSYAVAIDADRLDSPRETRA